MTVSRIPTGALVTTLALLLLPAAAAGQVDIAGLTHLDGTAVNDDEVSRDSLFVIFSTWSPKCGDIVPRVNDLHEEWGRRTDIFLVNFQEDAATVNKFVAGGSSVQVLLDSEASFSKKHKITYLPSLLAVKDGSAAFHGKLPSDTGPVLRSIYE